SIENLQAFTSGLQAVFIRTGSVADWVGNLANHDVRRCLQLTREIVASPYIKVSDLLKAYIGHTSLEVNPEDVQLAIIRGRYDTYPLGQSAFIQNIYALITETDTTPLLGVRILQQLEDTRFQDAEGEARYAHIDHIVDYFAAMNIDPSTTRLWLDSMLKCG